MSQTISKTVRLCSVVAVAFLTATASAASLYSLTPGSAAIGPPPASGDIILSEFVPGLTVIINSVALGAGPTGNIDAMSYGFDSRLPVGPSYYVHLRYSVSPGTIGSAPVPNLYTNSAPIGAANFRGFITGPGRFAGPIRSRSAAYFGLGAGDDMDALQREWRATPPNQANQVFFSVSVPTASAMGVAPGDILCQPTPFAGGAPGVWAAAAFLGLGPTDNVDALLVRRPRVVNEFPCAAIVPGDGTDIYVSFSPGSPILGTLAGGSAATVYGLMRNGAVLTPPFAFVLPGDLGLLAADDIDAMTSWNPKAPGWGTPGPWGQGLLCSDPESEDCEVEDPCAIGECVNGYCEYTFVDMPGCQAPEPELADIPTVSTWGVCATALLIMCAATIVLRRSPIRS